ncbi:MAG: type II toxin-antitoxin system RelE/ParE family toxin [Desulfobacteraceae bacterium]
MVLQVAFHPDVKLDIGEAYKWYQQQAQGLGDDYIIELELAFQTIAEISYIWPKFKKKFRRYILSRFPFAVIYKESGHKLYVVAVMHQSRKPNYWIKRL